jgi:mono/diheme cytochrome c family protein
MKDGVRLASGFVLTCSLILALCTGVLAETSRLSASGPPLLALSSKIADPDWLVAWLLEPSRLRSGTSMPDFALSPKEAQAIARHLYGSMPGASDRGAIPEGDAERGRRLFVSRGCRGCHAVAPGESSLSPRVPNLAGTGIKVRREWLLQWLKNPRTYDRQTAMPQLDLSDEDIRHLVAFLMTLKEGAEIVSSAARFDPHAESSRGRALLDQYECATCHQIEGFPPPEPPLQLSDGSDTDSVLRDGRALVEYYNCRGCHQIEGSGGAIAKHLERKTFAPPKLDGEGVRVQTSWLVSFLRQPTSLRPWLEMRMPRYELSETEANALAKYFAALANVPAGDETLPPADSEIASRGLRRLAHYKCVQCHPSTPRAPEGVDPENLSIDLTLARQRLRPSWIRDFLARPKAIVGTQTRMPTVFYTVDGKPKVEHPEGDIEAITAYLLHATEPIQAALAALDADRRAAEKKQQIDWTTYEY